MRHATQNEITAYRDRTRAEYPGFIVNVNRYGLHVRCPHCRHSNTTFPESWMREHQCPEK